MEEGTRKEDQPREEHPEGGTSGVPGKGRGPSGPDEHEPKGGKGQGRQDNVQKDPDDQRRGADPKRHRP